MKIIAKRQSLIASSKELLILPIEVSLPDNSKQKKAKSAFNSDITKQIKEFDTQYDNAISSTIARQDFYPTSNKKLLVPLSTGKNCLQIKLCCLSSTAFSSENTDIETWRKLGADAYKTAESLKAKSIGIDLSKAPRELLAIISAAVAEGVYLAEYKFNKYKNKKALSKYSLNNVNLLLAKSPTVRITKAIEQASFKAKSAIIARNLVNTPAGDLTTKEFVREAKKLCKKQGSRLEVQVFSETQLKKMGAYSLLSVAEGSSQPPYLLHIKYKPAIKVKHSKKIALVGKGVTFDSGGLSIKPGQGMYTMKCDMAGAAAVLGTMSSLAKLGVIHEVHGIIPLVENMINGHATRPGDIVKAINGKTIEILNTDAEGRLILADALCYSKRVKPDTVIDLATLTGACMVALGTDIAGSYTNNSKLKASLLESSKLSGEKIWPMPLEESYRKLLDSPIADMKNIGDRYGGSITAALFLKEFVPENTAWAHIDIAGPAFADGASEYSTAGATGFGVRLLLEMLSKS